MLRYFAIIFFATTLPLQTATAWDIDSGEDAMTDKKIALTMQQSHSGGLSMRFKCWDNQNAMAILMFPIRYDESATYKPLIEVAIRADKTDPETFFFEPRNISGRFGLVMEGQGAGNTIHDLMAGVRDAKTRIAISVNNMQQTFSASGSKKAIGTLFQRCKIVESSTESDVASAPPTFDIAAIDRKNIENESVATFEKKYEKNYQLAFVAAALKEMRIDPTNAKVVFDCIVADYLKKKPEELVKTTVNDCSKKFVNKK